ncbi:hypothetical protein BJ944DRAFT_265650 [Cunninghamella echinulata]|nr:hypothetical protein BJ944DRAFT_265650 [Cunninghamella echinulata]
MGKSIIIFIYIYIYISYIRNEYSTPTIIRTDTIRTQYQPEIKILKRSPNKPKGPRLPEDNDTQPIKKTLAEREKDYLLARERIFGEKSQ